MVSIGNDSHYDLFDEIDEKPTESEKLLLLNNYNTSPKNYEIIKTEEPSIEVKEEACEPDPLLIEQTFEPFCNLVASHRVKAPRTYSRVPKRKDEVKKIIPQLPLDDLVMEAMEALDKPKGNTATDIKRFVNSKYGTNYIVGMVTKALQAGVTSGALSRRYGDKKKHYNGRYILPQYDSGRSKPLTKRQMKSILRSKRHGSCNLQQGKNLGKNDFGLKKIGVKPYPPIRKDRIDLMVLHSIYCLPDYQGIRLYEIAEFIENFYDIDSLITVPYVEKYLDYCVQEKILFKHGEKYKRAATSWKANFKNPSTTLVKYDETSCPTDRSICAGNETTRNDLENVSVIDVDLEPQRVADSSKVKLESNCEGNVEINTNNNIIQSIDGKQEGAYVLRERSNCKRKISPPIESTSTSKKRKTLPPPQYYWNQPKIGSGGTRVALANSIKTKEQQIKLETVKTSEEVFASFARRKVLPFSFENIRTIERQTRRVTVKSETPENSQILFRQNQAEINKTQFDFHGAFDEPTYTLDEMNEYIARYPKLLLNNSVTLMWDLSWEESTLTGNVPCLKLTGIGTLSNDDPNCKICGFEFKFGAPSCDICYFDQENIMEKCNICDLLCNCADVFYNHFLWEHRPLIQAADNPSVSISEENFEKLLSKLAPDGLFCCGICKYLTDNIEVFEQHLVNRHSSRMNVLPPLPEEEINGGMVIFRNEIANLCCLRCMECGFISNRRDFMVFHILEIHELEVENEKTVETRSLNIEVRNKDDSGKKVKWSFGLCHICGNLYNNILLHLKRHRRVNIAAQIEKDTSANKSAQNLDEALIDTLESLPLADRLFMIRSERPRRNRKRNAKKRSYLCPICGKLLKRRLGEHLRIHNPQMHECNVCGKKFNRQSNLLTHKRVHTREKPFQCDICKMTFGYKCSIKGHIVNVHSETVR